MEIEIIRIGGPDLRPVNEFTESMENVLTEGLARIDAATDEELRRIQGDD